jgi:thymidylate kinase
MKPHFILEGPDCTGKTTLARDLEREGWRYHHEGPPPEGRDQLAHYVRTLVELTSTSRPVVFDRFHHGELVYGRVLRGGSQLSWEDFEFIERVRKAQGVLSVLCRGSYKSALARWLALKERRHELVNDAQTYREIWTAYQELPFDFTGGLPRLQRWVREQQAPFVPLLERDKERMLAYLCL